MKNSIYYLKTAIMLIIIILAYQASAAIHTITVQDYIFTPASIANVKVGDTIHWDWLGGIHTTTSTTIPTGAAPWDHPMTSTSTSFEYIPTLPGVYNYHCSIHFSMGMIASFTVVSPTDVAEIKNTPSVKIYPNPFNDRVSFEFFSDKSFMRNLKIFDVTGRVSKDLIFSGDPSQTTFTLYLTDLPKGVYLFQFIDNLNRLNTRRVIKQ
jgi:plastocyanin